MRIIIRFPSIFRPVSPPTSLLPSPVLSPAPHSGTSSRGTGRGHCARAPKFLYETQCTPDFCTINNILIYHSVSAKWLCFVFVYVLWICGRGQSPITHWSGWPRQRCPTGQVNPRVGSDRVKIFFVNYDRSSRVQCKILEIYFLSAGKCISS